MRANASRLVSTCLTVVSPKDLSGCVSMVWVLLIGGMVVNCLCTLRLRTPAWPQDVRTHVFTNHLGQGLFTKGFIAGWGSCPAACQVPARGLLTIQPTHQLPSSPGVYEGSVQRGGRPAQLVQPTGFCPQPPPHPHHP